jgi:uncharacterized membrane protein YbhN (UPF0104 family)
MRRLAGGVVDAARRRPAAVSAVATTAALAALVLVLAGRRDEFASALAGAPGWPLALAAALHVLFLVARSEAWTVCVRSAGGTVGRRRVYRAASVGYVGAIVNGELGFAMRIAALRRSAPRETPRATALAATEVPILAIEGCLAALTSFTLVGPLGLPWWTPLALFAAMLAALAGLRRLAAAHRRGMWRGLSVLRDARARVWIVGLMVVAVCLQIARNWLLLHASGVDASVFDATAVLIAVAALGVLPLGPSVGAGAAVLILGADGVAPVAAAGVLMTATGAIGALSYGAWALLDRLSAAVPNPLRVLRHRRLRSARALAIALHDALAALPAHRRRAVEHA